MRIRRERAAAWAAKKAAAEAPSSLPKATPLNIEGSSANLVVSVERPVPKDASKRDSFPSWSKHTKTLSGDQNNSSRDEDSQRKRKGAFDDESESKFARNGKPAGWMAWAEQVSGPSHPSEPPPAGESVHRGRGEEKEKEGYGWRSKVGGLETVAVSFGAHNSASARAAEEEQRLEQMDEDYSLPRDHRPQSYIDMTQCEMASMDRHIPDSNKGFQMLLRMGWKGVGSGLGRKQDGIFDPIPLSSKDPLDLLFGGSKVGVGRLEEENAMHEVATDKRKELESEIQASETEERKQKREEQVEKTSAIKDEIKEIVSVFYCDICDKQYKTDEQFQEHLNSYDHHHKKRFMEFQKEQKAMKGGPTACERQKKEEKRMQKEMAARAAALLAAQRQRQEGVEEGSEGQPPAPAPVVETSSDAAALPAEAIGTVKFSFGSKPKADAPKKIGMGMAVGKGRGAPPARPQPMAFGDDSD